ncbi:MAG: hypothetical protein LIP02_05820 [Bacteroidales bacterium]|nr:hypothetical protein [Bacteroidales bacterium]
MKQIITLFTSALLALGTMVHAADTTYGAWPHNQSTLSTWTGGWNGSFSAVKDSSVPTGKEWVYTLESTSYGFAGTQFKGTGSTLQALAGTTLKFSVKVTGETKWYIRLGGYDSNGDKQEKQIALDGYTEGQWVEKSYSVQATFPDIYTYWSQTASDKDFSTLEAYLFALADNGGVKNKNDKVEVANVRFEDTFHTYYVLSGIKSPSYSDNLPIEINSKALNWSGTMQSQTVVYDNDAPLGMYAHWVAGSNSWCGGGYLMNSKLGTTSENYYKALAECDLVFKARVGGTMPWVVRLTYGSSNDYNNAQNDFPLDIPNDGAWHEIRLNVAQLFPDVYERWAGTMADVEHYIFALASNGSINAGDYIDFTDVHYESPSTNHGRYGGENLVTNLNNSWDWPVTIDAYTNTQYKYSATHSDGFQFKHSGYIRTLMALYPSKINISNTSADWVTFKLSDYNSDKGCYEFEVSADNFTKYFYKEKSELVTNVAVASPFISFTKIEHEINFNSDGSLATSYIRAYASKPAARYGNNNLGWGNDATLTEDNYTTLIYSDPVFDSNNSIGAGNYVRTMVRNLPTYIKNLAGSGSSQIEFTNADYDYANDRYVKTISADDFSTYVRYQSDNGGEIFTDVLIPNEGLRFKTIQHEISISWDGDTPKPVVTITLSRNTWAPSARYGQNGTYFTVYSNWNAQASIDTNTKEQLSLSYDVMKNVNSSLNRGYIRTIVKGLPSSYYDGGAGLAFSGSKIEVKSTDWSDSEGCYKVEISADDFANYFFLDNVWELACDITGDNTVSFSTVKIEFNINTENGKPATTVIRLYKAETERANWAIHFWHGPILSNLKANENVAQSEKDAEYFYFTYDEEKSTDSSTYDYYKIAVTDGTPDAIKYVVQCNIDTYSEFFFNYPGYATAKDATSGGLLRFYFDARESDKWVDLQKYDSRINHSRAKVGIKTKNIWLRAKRGETDPYKKFDIMFDSNGSINVDADEQMPINTEQYSITVAKGTPLYTLLHGSSDADEVTLDFSKHIASDDYYQINLGRNISLDIAQAFQFKINNEVNQNVQFNVSDTNYDDSMASAETRDMSYLAGGTEFNRIILKVTYEGNAYKYQLSVHKIGGDFPINWNSHTTTSLPLLKAWSGDDYNSSKNIVENYTASEASTLGVYFDQEGSVNYYKFMNVWVNETNADGSAKSLSYGYEVPTGKVAHPNEFYLPFPAGGITLNAGMNAILSGSAQNRAGNTDGFCFDTDNDAMDHLDFFNLIDEDGYDVANPFQGGQWFYKNTWWCCNPRVAPEGTSNETMQDIDAWTPDMRPKTGTPGDLVVGEEMKVYGITLFRIGGTKYDMYMRDDQELAKKGIYSRFVDGNIYYLYFDTENKGPELTLPILVDYKSGSQPSTTKNSGNAQFVNYQGRDLGYPTSGTVKNGWSDSKYYNLRNYISENQKSGVATAADGDATTAKPVSMKLYKIKTNGDALYTMELDSYSPAVPNPFAVSTITASLTWPNNASTDAMLPSQYVLYYFGESTTATELVNSTSTVDDTDMSYSRLYLATNSDQLRYQLQANTAVIDAEAYNQYQTDESKQADEPVIYPTFDVQLRMNLNAADLAQSSNLPIKIYATNTNVASTSSSKVVDQTQIASLTPYLALTLNDAKITGTKVTFDGTYQYSTNESTKAITSRLTAVSESDEINADPTLNDGDAILNFDLSFLLDPSLINGTRYVFAQVGDNVTNLVTTTYNNPTPQIALTMSRNTFVETNTSENKRFGTHLTITSNDAENELPHAYSLYRYYESSQAWHNFMGHESATLNQAALSQDDFEKALTTTWANAEAFKKLDKCGTYGDDEEDIVVGQSLTVAGNNYISYGESWHPNGTNNMVMGYAVTNDYIYAYPETEPLLVDAAVTGFKTSDLTSGKINAGSARPRSTISTSTLKSHTLRAYAQDTQLFTIGSSTGVEDVATDSDVTILAGQGQVTVLGCDTCQIYNLRGEMIYSGATGTIPVASGLAIVATPTTTAKVLVR